MYAAMDVESESDSESSTEDENSSDEDFIDDSESEIDAVSSDHSDEEPEIPSSPVVVGLEDSNTSIESEPPAVPSLPSSSQNSQSSSLQPQRAEAATLASEVTGHGTGNEQNITREPNISSEPSCSSEPTRKRIRKSLSPVVGNDLSVSNDDDSMTCPICFEFWTTSGVHRLVSLKCGHLFGLSCIERWIKQPQAKCPQCNNPARKNDIRKIYARVLKVLDTSERDQAMKELAAEQEKRRHAEVDTAAMRMKLTLVSQECERYKKELIDHKNTIELLRQASKKAVGRNGGKQDLFLSQPLGSVTTQKTTFVLDKTLDLCKEGGCRVLAVSNMLPVMVVSQPSTNPLFPSFGFKKISTMDFRQTEFVPVHKKELKDLAFHSHDSLVLSTALDKTVKVTNIYSNSIVQSYDLDMDAWSCCWNKDDPISFYVGLRDGRLLHFDTRMTSTHVCQLSSGKKLPVVAVQYLAKTQPSTYGMAGPVSLQLSACTFYEQKSGTEYKVHPMPVEGSFTSLSIEPITGHMLVSCRPSAYHSKVTHLLCELTFKNLSQEASVIDKSCSCNVIQSLEGGPFQTQLTRSRLLLNPANNSSVLVCSGDENTKAVKIWDARNSELLNQLPANSTVLDICSFRSDSAFCLGALTDKQLRIYRWNEP